MAHVRFRTAVGALCALLAVPLVAGPTAAQPAELAVRTLSNRADLLSAGDALVEVVLPAGVAAADVAVSVEGRVVSDAFAVRADGRFLGRVEGMALGVNRLVATLPDGSGAYLDVVNHPANGPVLAGHQVQPWICSTEAAGLGPAADHDCSAEVVYAYFHRSSATMDFQPYDPAAPPGDVAETTTDEGATVPYIVRRERGTLDRGVYDIAVLFDPEQPWEPWAPQEGWNGKLGYLFGGGCAPNHNQTAGEDVLHHNLLSRGFAVASGGLNVLGNNCNDVVSAESVMMVKERLVERYGEIRYTIGDGCSGGSIQQHLIAANYPGLLDGIQPSCSYPDVWSLIGELFGCELLLPYFNANPDLWPDAGDQAAVTGHATRSACEAWVDGFGFPRSVGDPTTGCNGLVIPATRPGITEPDYAYHPESNPDGVRCTLQDYEVAIFGADADTGWAPRPFDNVGVQYGLQALEDGALSPEQFVDLNAEIGGLDLDYQPTAERSVADEVALETVYRTGRVTNATLLADVPIMDLRGSSNLEIHTDYQTHVLRARLVAANGNADNHVHWNTPGPLAVHPPVPVESLELLDGWLAAIEADTAPGTQAERVVRNRPAEAVDACWIAGQKITDTAQCEAALPYFASPLLVAGAPWTNDVLKCALQPLDRAGYAVAFSDAQWERMEAAFPDGVCDWSQPGVGQQPPAGPWQTFADGPGGRVLGPEPASVPFGPDGAPVRIERHGGSGRVETAALVSGLGIEDATTVVLARADVFADALAGAPLAVHLGAPLLLSAPDALSAATRTELERLGATAAVLLGGDAALAPDLAADLEALGLAVRRLAGADRFETAAAIAAELPATDEVLVAQGGSFPDALSASALGAATGTPILLVGGDLPQATAASAAGRDAVLVGGPGAISEAIAAELDAGGGAVRRLAGATRYETSRAVAEEALARGITAAVTWVATGADFPDGLVAGTAAGSVPGLLLLIDGQDLAASAPTRDLLAAHADGIRVLHIAGGTNAISAAVEEALAAALAG